MVQEAHYVGIAVTHFMSKWFQTVITPHMITVKSCLNFTWATVRAEKSDRCWCPYCIYMFVVEKKYFNRTLAIDSPFQTFTVGFLVEFID